jgi:serine/threonine protein kinase
MTPGLSDSFPRYLTRVQAPTTPTCTGYPNFEDSYVAKNKMGKGMQAQIRVATHMASGTDYVARFSFNEQDVKAVQFGVDVCGSPHVPEMVDIACHEGGYVTLYRKFAGIHIGKFFPPVGCTDLMYDEVRLVLKQVYQTLRFLDAHHICHCDLANTNVLFHREARQVGVIDFGMSVRMPHEWGAINSTTLRQVEDTKFKITFIWANGEPRLYQDDILALGAFLAQFLSLPTPWRPEELPKYNTMLLKVAGTHELVALAKKYKFKLPKWIAQNMTAYPKERMDWRAHENECNKGWLTDDAVDMLNGLLQYSYTERRAFFLDAHAHPFFNIS